MPTYGSASNTSIRSSCASLYNCYMTPDAFCETLNNARESITTGTEEYMACFKEAPDFFIGHYRNFFEFFLSK